MTSTSPSDAPSIAGVQCVGVLGGTGDQGRGLAYGWPGPGRR